MAVAACMDQRHLKGSSWGVDVLVRRFSCSCYRTTAS